MAWRNVKVEDQREYLIKSYIDKSGSMSDLCKECGVSRKTGYKWLHRYNELGLKGLADQKRAPLNPQRKFTEMDFQVALELKLKYPKYGPKKILAILERKYPNNCWPCHTRLYQIFKEHHLVSSRKLRRRVPRTNPLGEVNASNDVWCADFKGWFKTQDQVKIEPFTVTDGYSRFLIRCLHLERKRMVDVWKILSDAFLEFGLPKRFRTDNGPPFATTGVGRLSMLSINLVKVGVVPEWITPGHPEENGRHERFHRTLKDAIANPTAENYSEQILRMSVFVEEYNFERPHEALNQQVPGSHYEPSQREWDGKLRSPEYNEKGLLIRKVRQNGCMSLRQVDYYLGQLLGGEYVGLEEFDNECFKVFYGPVFLGTITKGSGFAKPVMPRRR